MTKSDPWYIHAILWVVIVILAVVLVKVAIIDPKETVKMEKYYRTESRLRMNNIKEAQILWAQQHDSYTGNLDSLIEFVKTSEYVDSIRNSFDSLARRPADPFLKLTSGEFIPESLYYTPKTHEKYILKVDTSVVVDTVVNTRGQVRSIDTTVTIGTMYYLEDPAGYGSVGSIDNETQLHTPSWE